ncbi:contactin-4-like [Macrobrachium rosenbergii]|uniref:contactin-4-like n=1 Tax=Macrobrachium rosenbergii TaxID=79674 RepID=UPI0034D619FF
MKVLFTLFILYIVTAEGAKPKVRIGLEHSPLTSVQAVEGDKVLLPCDVRPPEPDDDTILVLFYRGSIGTPIYSIDGRNGPVRQAHHWSDENTLGKRAYFDLSANPSGLVINPVRSSDHDMYRCRTDFRSSPTKNVRVQLQIIVPPRRMRIVTEAGVDVSGVIGPYPVGASLKLQCIVEGGQPRPHLIWWNENKLLDDVAEEKLKEVTVNTLTLPSLSRGDLYKVFTCQASNSNISAALAAAVTLDMSFPPLDVRIHGDVNRPFSEGERYQIVCESSGSRPTATITWWKNSILMTDARTQVFQEGNVSRSTLHLMPSLSDDGVHISCRAKNPLVPAAVMEDSIKLKVHYTPRLSLAAGQNLDMEDIKEGDDVYFECGILANPKVFKVQWFHNGEEICQNVTAGVIQSNQSLVLQRVTKSSSGQYTCAASNLHGSSSSNAVQLSVKFSPLCRSGQKIVYGAGKEEELNITCSIEAHPEPTHYRWAFNTSSEVMDLPSDRIWVVGKGRSQASYTPHSHQDYGSLLCWAENDVGMQAKPCIYHIIHAAPPDPVNNCTVENVSSTSVDVQCQAGWDGGLSQTFTLSVSHANGQTRGQDKKEEAPRVLANTSTSPRPQFSLTGLQPGTEYVLTIMGVNKKGQSEPVRMAIFTLQDKAEKRTSPVKGSGMAMTSLVGVVVGVLTSLLVMALVILAVVRSKRGQIRKPEVKMVYHKGPGCSSRGNDEEGGGDDPNPDVIPVNDDHQVSTPETSQQPQQQQVNIVKGVVLDQQQAPRTIDMYSDPNKQQVMKDYLQGHDGSFYINPGTLMKQKTGGLPLDPDPMSLMGCPLAASTPTAIGTAPAVYGPHEGPLTTLTRQPPPYGANVSSPVITPYSHPVPPGPHSYVPQYEHTPAATTSTYNPELGFMPLPTSYTQDFPPDPLSKSYGSEIEALPPCYAEYNLSLGRKKRQAMGCGSGPLGSKTGISHASTFSMGPSVGEGCGSSSSGCPPEGLTGCPVGQDISAAGGPWPHQPAERDPSSPQHRESSV